MAKHSSAEVEEQADTKAAESEIGQQLGFVDSEQSLDGLKFHDQRPIDKEVDAVARAQWVAIVQNRDLDFARVGYVALGELSRQSLLIGRL